MAKNSTIHYVKFLIKCTTKSMQKQSNLRDMEARETNQSNWVPTRGSERKNGSPVIHWKGKNAIKDHAN